MSEVTELVEAEAGASPQALGLQACAGPVPHSAGDIAGLGGCGQFSLSSSCLLMSPWVSGSWPDPPLDSVLWLAPVSLGGGGDARSSPAACLQAAGARAGVSCQL